MTDSLSKPDPEKFLMRRVFLWLPRRMFSFDFKCPECGRSLHSKGLSHKVRTVLDIKDYYYIVTEFLGCTCKKTLVSTDQRIINQLPSDLALNFPAVLTSKYACDKSIISLMKSRTIGNSSHALKNTLHEIHSEHWMKLGLDYMSSCKQFKAQVKFEKKDAKFIPFPSFRALPTPAWLLSVYVRDVWSRLDSCKSQVTSMFGDILKIDSNKKMLRKLAGNARKTASWVTNVSNGYGGVLQCVLTAAESNEALEPMAQGLQKRYHDANVNPPSLLYTDRDCCSNHDKSRYQKLFSSWENLEVRLDIWHFMRRLAGGCTSEKHPLYPSFLRQLSACIFEWDKADFEDLVNAKREELQAMGIASPSHKAIMEAVNKQELALHCRRRTRGVSATIESIEDLILLYTGVTDSLGVPLWKAEMVDIWNKEKKHIPCIQDPKDISLYLQVGMQKKGKHMLPTFRCARGSTSLEAFHSHIVHFIPGYRANDVNFQAYLLEGLARWNIARADAVEVKSLSQLRSFDDKLVTKFNEFHKKIFGVQYNERLTPNQPTNEAIGLEYLYRQTNQSFDEETIAKDVNDGVEMGDDGDEGIEEDFIDVTVVLPIEEQDEQVEDVLGDSIADEPTATDSFRIPGWKKIDKLAQALLNATGISLCDSDAAKIVELYDQLEEYDKKPITYKAISKRPVSGKFQQKRRSGFIDVVRMSKSFISGTTPALHPAKSRLVEAILIHLCQQISSPGKRSRGDGNKPTYVSRWSLIIQEYKKLRARVLNSRELLDKTGITLYMINETTLRTWHQDKERTDQIKVLMQGLDVPVTARIAKDPLPAPREKPQNLHGDSTSIQFAEPVDRSNQANFKKCKKSATQIDTGPEYFNPFQTPLSPPNMQPFQQQQAQPFYFQMQHGVFPQQPQPMSRSTMYRNSKKQFTSSSTVTSADAKKRKIYCCRKCNRPANDGNHPQVKGRKYCPFVEGADTFENFKAAILKELEEKNPKN